ncbi:hypothetical protein HDU89_000687 [Geranomyces variabilis]|nr:hypothetical protein HDU89_000687 [Geranomyces variabilis]
MADKTAPIIKLHNTLAAQSHLGQEIMAPLNDFVAQHNTLPGWAERLRDKLLVRESKYRDWVTATSVEYMEALEAEAAERGCRTAGTPHVPGPVSANRNATCAQLD